MRFLYGDLVQNIEKFLSYNIAVTSAFRIPLDLCNTFGINLRVLECTSSDIAGRPSTAKTFLKDTVGNTLRIRFTDEKLFSCHT